MKSFFRKIQLALIALTSVSSLASTVVEDSKNRFVLDDDVQVASKYPCDDGTPGMQFVPERSFFLDGNVVPFRYYRVALPSNAKPRVSVSNLQTEPLGTSHCGADSLKILPVEVRTPFLKDGLWMTDIRVPLYVDQQGGVALRKQFKLQVDFEKKASSGVKPGARVLSHVENPKAAARFGVRNSTTVLRREAASELDNVQPLLDISIGDRNVATFSEDGLYALDYATVQNALAKVGRQNDASGMRVDQICIYGASPDTLADMGPGSIERAPNQLFEIPIEIVDKDGNGTFSKGDTIYFVGYGSGFWKRTDAEDAKIDNIGMEYFHSYSPYTFYQNFILGYKEVGKGLRLDKSISASGKGREIVLLRYTRAEEDALLIDTFYGKALDWEKASGKEWFWVWHERKDTTTVQPPKMTVPSTATLPGMVDGGKSFIGVSFFPHRSIASSSGVSQVADRDMGSKSYQSRMRYIDFNFYVNGIGYERKQFSLIPGGNFAVKTSALKAAGNSYSIVILPDSVQCDRFDGYTIAYQWNPSKASIDSSEWILPGKVTGKIQIPVGDDKNLRLMKFVNFRPQGLLNVSDGVAVDSVQSQDDVRYLLYRKDKPRSAISVAGIPSPEDLVLNRLSQISSKTEYLIIAPEQFIVPAESLATFRSSDLAITPYATTLVSAENIYRHYTGGAPSPVALRNFIAYARSVCPDLRFVLLAGSGHYDYRNLNVKLKNVQNFMPPFEKEEAVIEDFFAVLDSGERVRHTMLDIDDKNLNLPGYDLDLAVGRLPVSSESEFFDYVEKAKDYDKVGTFDHSEWKSTILWAADDAKNGNVPDNGDHTRMQESLDSIVDAATDKLGFRWNMKKVYLLDYEYDADDQKRNAMNDFMNILNQGALMTSYFGHGSKVAWASEGLLKQTYSAKLKNYKTYTVLNSFACTVGRFDEGDSRSLSEEFLVTPRAGAIASIAAVRETYGRQNKILANSFILDALSNSGATLGESLMKAKGVTGLESSSQKENNEFYVLLGEPVIRMPINDLKVSLDSEIDSIKALDKMKISGSVDGLTDGSIALTLREGRRTKRLWTQISDGDSMNVVHDGALIYSEVVPVAGGRFETEFVTPRKLNFGDSTAELRAWAYSSNERAVGRYLAKNIMISGMSNYADSLNDKNPPSISIQSCYSLGTPTSFADNQTIKLQTPACLQVLIEDSTALDYREQADEGISFEILGIENPYHPSPYLEQTSKRAVINKSFTTESYPAGKYVFKVRAQDVLGNVATKVLNLEITEKMKEGLADVFNVPNPVGKKGTVFYFKNLAEGRESTESSVDIFIYNQHGRLVKVLKDVVSGRNHWNGHDNYGRPLANGLYYYVVRNKVSVLSGKKLKNESWTKKQKLLISR